MPGSRKSYKVLVGFDYPPEKRAEPGDVIADIPEASVSWMLKQNVIEPAKPSKKKEG